LNPRFANPATLFAADPAPALSLVFLSVFTQISLLIAALQF